MPHRRLAEAGATAAAVHALIVIVPATLFSSSSPLGILNWKGDQSVQVAALFVLFEHQLVEPYDKCCHEQKSRPGKSNRDEDDSSSSSSRCLVLLLFWLAEVIRL